MKKILLTTAVILLLAAACNKQPITEQQNTTSPTPPANQSSNLQSYQNTKYGFSFQYPNSWHVKEQSDNLVGLCSNENTAPCANTKDGFVADISLRMYDNFKGLNAKAFLESQGLKLTPEGIGTPTDITIDGKSGLRFGAEGTALATIYIPAGNYILMLQAQSSQPDTKVFDQVISTLQFRNQILNQAVSMEVYTNTKYGFEIELPQTWKAYSEYDGSVLAKQPSQFPSNPLIITGTPPNLNFSVEFEEGLTIAKMQQLGLVPQSLTLSSTISLKGNKTGKKFASSDGGIFLLAESAEGTLKIYTDKIFPELDEILSSIIIK